MIKLNYCIPSLSILYQPPPPGVVSLSQALCSADDYSNSLLHLDLSKNPGVLSGEDATVRHKNCCIVCSHSNILMHTYCKKSWVEEGGEESCNIIIKIFYTCPSGKSQCTVSLHGKFSGLCYLHCLQYLNSYKLENHHFFSAAVMPP